LEERVASPLFVMQNTIQNKGNIFISVLVVILIGGGIAASAYLYFNLDTAKSKNSELKEQIKIARMQLEQTQQSLEEKSQEVTQLQESIEEQQVRVSDLEAAMSEKDEFAASLVEQLERDQQQILELMQNLEHEKKALVEFSVKLKENNARALEGLSERKEEFWQELAQIKKQKKDLEQKLFLLRKKVVLLFNEDALDKIDRIDIDEMQLAPIVVAAGGLQEARVLSVDHRNHIIAFDIGSDSGLRKSDVVNIFNGNDLIAKARVYRVTDTIASADLLIEYIGADIRENDIVRAYIDKE